MEVVVSTLDVRRNCPEQPLSLRCCLDGRCVVGCVEPRLQLADPVPAGGVRKMRIAFQVMFELDFVKLLIIKGPERRRQAPERSDEPELPGNRVDHETEPRLSCQF